MATFINDLRLTELATGEASGSWGTTTNVSLELLGEAMGVGAEAVANASTHTITMADGATDQFRSTFLRLTGGGQACTVTLAPNTVSHFWVMRNETAAALTLTQGSGANVVIAAGQTKLVCTDGAGSGAIVYEMDDLELAGNLIVDGDASIGDDLSLTSDSAVLKFGADGDTTLTHTDGTGLTLNSTNKLTFGDAATFIHQSSNGVMTIDGEATIDLNASTAVLVSNDLKLNSDSAVIGFGADNDTTLTHTDGAGLTLNSTNKIMFNDATQFIHAPTGTVLDIGATDEIELTATLIDVVGNLTVSGDIDLEGAIDVNGTTNLDVVDIDGAVNMATTALVTGVLTTTAATVFNGGFASNAASTVSVTSSSATEVAAFKVSGDTTPSIAIYSNNAIRAKLRASTAETALLSQGTLPLLLGTNNTERMRIDGSTGKVLIGTATNTTGDALQIESPASGGGFGIQIRRNDNNTDQQIGQIKFGNAVDEDLGQISVKTDGANNSGAILLSTASAGTTAERLRISKTGNITQNGATSADFLIKAATDNASLTLQAGASDSGAEGAFVSFVQNTAFKWQIGMNTDNTFRLFSYAAGSGAEVLNVSSAGELTLPLQPAFQAIPASAQNNIAINTNVTIVFGTERFDVGANFASNAFTAPVTGKYLLTALLRLDNFDKDATFYQLKITTSNKTYFMTFDPGGLASDPAFYSMTNSVVADMDASDTVSIVLFQGGGTAQTDIEGESYFSGILVA